MSAALAKAQLAASTLLQDVAALEHKAKSARSEADVLCAQQADNGAANAAAAAAAAATDAEAGARERDLRAALELQQRQQGDAQADRRAKSDDFASVLKSREATLEAQQTRIRELERSLLETQAALTRAHASHATEGALLAAVSRELHGVRDLLKSTDATITTREAQQAAMKREAAAASAQSREAAAQVAALRADVEQNMGAALQSARAEKWQAACALAASASKCGALETTVTTLQTELADTKAALATALDEKKDAVERAAQLAELHRCATCAALLFY
jgi:chromosome segregation ATPase